MTKGKFRPVLFFFIVWLHVMTIVAVWYGFKYGFSRNDFVWLIVIHTLRSIGVSLGYHRLFTHRTFKCHFVTEEALNFLGGMAAQGPRDEWVLDHDQHHWNTEGEWDPHSPTKYPGVRGFLWAHVWWLFYEVKRPNLELVVASARKNIVLSKWRWDRPVYFSGLLSGFIVPFVFTGWSGLLLSGFAGVVISWHITWLVNSLCHSFGGVDPQFRRTKDRSKNSWPLAIFSYIGEAWHNYHHQKADCAFHGWKWYHPDLGKWILIAFEDRLFWDIKRPPIKSK